MQKMQRPVAVKRLILVKAKAVQHHQAQTESHQKQETQIAVIYTNTKDVGQSNAWE